MEGLTVIGEEGRADPEVEETRRKKQHLALEEPQVAKTVFVLHTEITN